MAGKGRPKKYTPEIMSLAIKLRDAGKKWDDVLEAIEAETGEECSMTAIKHIVSEYHSSKKPATQETVKVGNFDFMDEWDSVRKKAMKTLVTKEKIRRSKPRFVTDTHGCRFLGRSER